MKLIRTLFFGILLIPFTSFADLALDATVGSITPASKMTSPNLDFTGHLWYPFDQMVFLGLGGGVQTLAKGRAYPILASLNMRLPIGGQILPVATGDWGWNFGSSSGIQWKFGGGLDIKNGDNSSILISAGIQNYDSKRYTYLRAGLLLEF